MSKRARIPRPRQVFPEVAAVLIECQRTRLRFTRNLRSAIGHVPAWTAGAMAGVMAIMLAISLFFVRDSVQAAPVERFPEPISLAPAWPVPAPLPTESAAGRPNLVIDIFPTRAFPHWDEDRILTVTSRPRISPAELQRLPDRGWRLAVRRPEMTDSFISYLQRHKPGDIQAVEMASAADSLPGISPPAAHLGLGILLEKHLPESAVAGQPVSYEIAVSNLLDAAIDNVTVVEELPSLSRVVDVVPAAGVRGNELVWSFSRLPPRGVRVLKVTIVPEMNGQLMTQTRATSVSRVAASARVSGKLAPAGDIMPPAKSAPLLNAVPGAPQLKLSYTPVEILKQGDVLSMIFSVTNIGTAPAEDVELYVRLSDQFEHRYGEFVRHRIQRLEPGETRRALLQATARTTGEARLLTTLTMHGTKTEARQLKIPIQAGPQQASGPVFPAGDGTRLSPSVQRPVADAGSRWVSRDID